MIDQYVIPFLLYMVNLRHVSAVGFSNEDPSSPVYGFIAKKGITIALIACKVPKTNSKTADVMLRNLLGSGRIREHVLQGDNGYVLVGYKITEKGLALIRPHMIMDDIENS